MSRDPSPDAPVRLDKAHRDRKESKKKRKRNIRADSTRHKSSPAPRERHRFTKARSLGSNFPGKSKDTLFCNVTCSFYLSLSPISQLHPIEGICAEHLSPLILTYYLPLKGIVLGYRNVRLSETSDQSANSGVQERVLAKSIDEFAVSFVWVTAEFIVFRPQRGAYIEGNINLQNESHIGLVCFNLFNASIDRKRLPSGWKWVGSELGVRAKKKLKQDSQNSDIEMQHQSNESSSKTSQAYDGHFEDENGNRIEGSIQFRIQDVEISASTDKEKSFITIQGTLVVED